MVLYKLWHSLEVKIYIKELSIHCCNPDFGRRRTFSIRTNGTLVTYELSKTSSSVHVL